VSKSLLRLPLPARYMLSRTSPPRVNAPTAALTRFEYVQLTLPLVLATRLNPRHGGKFRYNSDCFTSASDTVPCTQGPNRDQNAVRTLWGSCCLRRKVVVTSPVTMVTECILKVNSAFPKHVQENVARACKECYCQAR
jgi:hypothetical protein